jgi:hypothetical protein
MVKERAEKESYTERNVSKLLDQFIDAQFEAAEAQQRARQYKTSHPLPPAPERFADVRALANYASAQVRHEQILDQLDKDQREAEQRLRMVEGKVAALLPLGSTVARAYEGAHPDEHGILCEITHDQASDRDPRMPVDVPNIRVRWFSDQPGL